MYWTEWKQAGNVCYLKYETECSENKNNGAEQVHKSEMKLEEIKRMKRMG